MCVGCAIKMAALVQDVEEICNQLGIIQEKTNDGTTIILDTNVISPGGLYGIGVNANLTYDKLIDLEDLKEKIKSTTEILFEILKIPGLKIFPETYAELEKKLELLEDIQLRQGRRIRTHKKRSTRRTLEGKIERDAQQMSAIIDNLLLTNNRLMRAYNDLIIDAEVKPYHAELLSVLATKTGLRTKRQQDPTRIVPELLVTKTFELARQQPTTIASTSAYVSKLFALAAFLYFNKNSPIYDERKIQETKCYRLAEQLMPSDAKAPNFIFYTALKSSTPGQLLAIAKEEYAKLL